MYNTASNDIVEDMDMLMISQNNMSISFMEMVDLRFTMDNLSLDSKW